MENLGFVRIAAIILLVTTYSHSEAMFTKILPLLKVLQPQSTTAPLSPVDTYMKTEVQKVAVEKGGLQHHTCADPDFEHDYWYYEHLDDKSGLTYWARQHTDIEWAIRLSGPLASAPNKINKAGQIAMAKKPDYSDMGWTYTWYFSPDNGLTQCSVEKLSESAEKHFEQRHTFSCTLDEYRDRIHREMKLSRYVESEKIEVEKD